MFLGRQPQAACVLIIVNHLSVYFCVCSIENSDINSVGIT